MERKNQLRVVINRKVYGIPLFRLILICTYGLLLPFLILHLNRVENQGEDTSKLQKYVQSMIPKPQPVPSMWIEHDLFTNEPPLAPYLGEYNRGMVETFIILFPWRLYIQYVLNILAILLFHFLIRQFFRAKNACRHNGKWFVFFIFFVTAYALILCLAMDGTLTIVYNEIGESLHAWIDSNIVTVYLDRYFEDKTILHPFTQGSDPPYHLKYTLRYPAEDVVFECSYNVFGGADVEPINIKTWWRKNGVPIEVNDRLHVNVSIRNMDISSALEEHILYRIESTLTIEVIQPSDYGTYTCDYTNPMPQRIHVRPYVPKEGTGKVQSSEPMTPHPKCNCKPVFNQDGQMKPFVPQTVCFKEFVLRMPERLTRTVKLEPGGILISVASYRTVADMSDIKVDVTFEGNSDRKGSSECCSLFIKIYWALFRYGRFVDLPISRLVGQHKQNNTSYLTVVKFTCICKDSFGIRNVQFYRSHYNSTINKEEDIKIEHPVRLKVEHENNGPTPLFDGLSFCRKSDNGFCWYIEIILGNSLYIFYTYDVFLAFSFFIFCLSIYWLNKCSRSFIAQPLRKLCLWSRSGPFPAVEGPPVYLRISQGLPPCYRHSVFLSYSEDDPYDREVADYLKSLLKKNQMAVFDSVKDILPGQLLYNESAESVRNSARFVVIASKSYTEDTTKQMEFTVIQDTIISQDNEPINRLLIIQVEDCDIAGLHQVPCIRVPGNLKKIFSLDTATVVMFQQWIETTQPLDTNNRASHLSRLGFSWKSVLFIIILGFLAVMPAFYKRKQSFSNETCLVTRDSD